MRTLLLFLKKGFDFFVFSSLFIAGCAVLMVVQTTVLFSINASAPLLLFVFCGTVCSYNFHWFLTPPNVGGPTEKVIWNIRNRHLHLGFSALGLAGASVCGFLLLAHWQWLLVTAVFTFLYSAPKIPLKPFGQLKKIAVGKTIFLSLAWMHVTTLLPLLIASPQLPDTAILFALNRFFFIYALCILFDYRDRESDRREGIRSLVTALPEQGINELFWGSLLVAVLALALLWTSFPAGVPPALLLPSVLLGLLYGRAKREYSDYLYYFVLDGLMMLSAPFVILAKFAR